MLIELEDRDDVCIVRLQGRFITGKDADYLRAKSDEIKGRNCHKVLADFREVPYIDSTGIGFVVGLYTSVTKSTGGRFILAGASHRVREVLDLTRLSTVLPMADDLESGLAALQK